MRRMCILGVLLALALLPGCAPGYNSILFATRSNLGFDADTSPPNLEIGISRYEGVLEPTFEGGQTVPVMGSFASDSDAFYRFFVGVRSTFSTGEAAYIMSNLYNKPDSVETPPYKNEMVTLTQEPNVQLPFGRQAEYVTTGKVKPVIFGTDTNLGVKIRWSGQTAQYPSSINIGFKRKEAAWAPIGVRKKPDSQSGKPADIAGKQTEGSKSDNPDGAKYEVDAPALLATINVGVSAETGANLTYLQYFATGSAAKNLARKYPVREAMLRRGDPLQAKIADEGIKSRELNWKYINQIKVRIRAITDNNKKNAIIAKAKEIDLVPKSVDNEKDFLKALGEHGDAPPPITSKLEELAKFASEQ